MPTLKLFSFLALSFLGLPLSTLVAKDRPLKAKPSPPNIVFLLSDDVNFDTWGTYGSKDCQTPNIDQLAKDGVKFNRAFAAVAMCAPFRQELYSGRSPWRTGTLANHSRSKANTKSLPHYLKPLGYRVTLLGKSHVGPNKCYPFEHINHGDKRKDHNPFYLKKATEIMDESQKNRKPFCLFVTSNDGHGPFTTGDPSAYKADYLTVPPYWLDTPALRRNLVKYYAEITNFDHLVGQMRSALEKRGLWDNTLFIVCSEQGSSLPFAKWTCYRNGLKSGLVAHGKGLTSPGTVIDELVSIADIAPTLVDIAGGNYKKNDFDGKSFLSLLSGDSQALQKYVFGAFTNCNMLGSQKRIFPIRSIRSKTHSLVYNPNFNHLTSNITLDDALAILKEKTPPNNHGVATSWVEQAKKDSKSQPLVHKLHHRPEYELYDLINDPHELVNLIDHPEQQRNANELKVALHHKLKALGDHNPIQTERSLVKNNHQ